MIGSIGYITKFMAQAIDAHPDFATASWTFNLLSPGTDDIIVENGQYLGSITSQSSNIYSFSIPSTTYVSGTSYSTDVNYLTNDQSVNVVRSTTSNTTPDLPWSSSGSTSISFSISNYIKTAPSWVSINPSTGELTIITPQVISSTEYFYISSTISGIYVPINKLIKLAVTKGFSSETAQGLSITVSSLVGAILGMTVIASLLNTTSLASF